MQGHRVDVLFQAFEAPLGVLTHVIIESHHHLVFSMLHCMRTFRVFPTLPTYSLIFHVEEDHRIRIYRAIPKALSGVRPPVRTVSYSD